MERQVRLGWKALADHFLALRPERLRALRIERVGRNRFGIETGRRISDSSVMRQFWLRRPSSSLAFATTPAQSDVAAPCGTVFH
jgi:hypothetical protein